MKRPASYDICSVIMPALTVALATMGVVAAPPGWRTQPLDLRSSGGETISAISVPAPSAKLAGTRSANKAAAFPFPRLPIGGPQYLVAIAVSDERSTTDIDYEHNLHYVGVDQLDSPPPNNNFAIG